MCTTIQRIVRKLSSVRQTSVLTCTEWLPIFYLVGEATKKLFGFLYKNIVSILFISFVSMPSWSAINTKRVTAILVAEGPKSRTQDSHATRYSSLRRVPPSKRSSRPAWMQMLQLDKYLFNKHFTAVHPSNRLVSPNPAEGVIYKYWITWQQLNTPTDLVRQTWERPKIWQQKVVLVGQRNYCTHSPHFLTTSTMHLKFFQFTSFNQSDWVSVSVLFMHSSWPCDFLMRWINSPQEKNTACRRRLWSWSPS